MKFMLTAVLATALAAAAAAAQSNRESKGVAGAWELVIDGPALHGTMNATLELEQEGTKVTGTMTAHGNSHTLAGEFVKGELTVETTDTPAGQAITLTAKLRDDGTLAGYLSSAHGDRQWTASRIKARK